MFEFNKYENEISIHFLSLIEDHTFLLLKRDNLNSLFVDIFNVLKSNPKSLKAINNIENTINNDNFLLLKYMQKNKMYGILASSKGFLPPFFAGLQNKDEILDYYFKDVLKFNLIQDYKTLIKNSDKNNVEFLKSELEQEYKLFYEYISTYFYSQEAMLDMPLELFYKHFNTKETNKQELLKSEDIIGDFNILICLIAESFSEIYYNSESSDNKDLSVILHAV